MWLEGGPGAQGDCNGVTVNTVQGEAEETGPASRAPKALGCFDSGERAMGRPLMKTFRGCLTTSYSEQALEQVPSDAGRPVSWVWAASRLHTECPQDRLCVKKPSETHTHTHTHTAPPGSAQKRNPIYIFYINLQSDFSSNIHPSSLCTRALGPWEAPGPDTQERERGLPTDQGLPSCNLGARP